MTILILFGWLLFIVGVSIGGWLLGFAVLIGWYILLEIGAKVYEYITGIEVDMD